MIDEYIQYTDHYSKRYPKSIVLHQTGSFYEIYGYKINETLYGANVAEICDILNIQMTRRNKTILEVSRQNPNMAGIPCYAISKYIDILTQNNYTIVLVDQHVDGKVITRKVSNIISPSLNATNSFVTDSERDRFLASLYLTSVNHPHLSVQNIISSISYIDATTNLSYIVSATDHDTSINLEDTFKTLITIKPVELIVFTDIETKSNTELMTIIQNFVTSLPFPCIHNNLNSVDDKMFKKNFQNNLLQKLFPNCGLLSVVEFLDLEYRSIDLISFCHLLQFICDHDKRIANGIVKPYFIESSRYMSIINNAIENLNIITTNGSTAKTSSVMRLLNNCKTNMGKRYFKHQLTNPLMLQDEIIKRYDDIDRFIDRYESYRSILSNIHDIDRLYKKVIMGTLQPSEFQYIDTSLKSILLLVEDNYLSTHPSGSTGPAIISFMQQYQSCFNFDVMNTVNLNQITKSFIDNDPEIQAIENEIALHDLNLEHILRCLNIDENVFKLNSNNIEITSARYQKLLKDPNRISKIDNALKNYNISWDNFYTKPISTGSKTIRLTQTNAGSVDDLYSRLSSKVTEKYLEKLVLLSGFSDLFIELCNFISWIDFSCNNAKNAVDFCYTRPILENAEDVPCSSGFIEAQDIRHPLIERINTEIPYVGNDISIGRDTKGILLYGINSVGKSSLMKSVGVNLIMAQCGMFVAAKSFRYRPYRYIMTRVPGGDNIFKNQSTFVAEMNEIKNILRRSDSSALIIGDEICGQSTENMSSISIVSSVINRLYRTGASYIFASHLHELVDLECIKSIETLKVFHLHVYYNDQKECLIYDRKLREGNGDTLYGLEVCKSLDLDKDFLSFANKVRDEMVMKRRPTSKVSKYNAKVISDVCDLCNSECDEIHHIAEQKFANKDGIIDRIHKNRRSNLVKLCAKCHDSVHAGEIIIHGYIQTSDGILLDWIKKDADVNEKKIRERVFELRNLGKTYKDILNVVKEEYQKKITLYMIKKILNSFL